VFLVDLRPIFSGNLSSDFPEKSVVPIFLPEEIGRCRVAVRVGLAVANGIAGVMGDCLRSLLTSWQSQVYRYILRISHQKQNKSSAFPEDYLFIKPHVY
jgi:hypothetical protein